MDDVGFLVAMIDQVQAEYKSDPARVFVVGVSNGAMMAYRMGCELAPRIAGVGSVAGAMVLDDCYPTRPVPVIEIHGTADWPPPISPGTARRRANAPRDFLVAARGARCWPGSAVRACPRNDT